MRIGSATLRARMAWPLVFVSAAQAPAAADPFAEFRIPAHTRRSATLEVGLDGSWSNRVSFDTASRSDHFAGDLRLSTSWSRDSDAHVYDLTATLWTLRNRSRDRFDDGTSQRSSRREFFSTAVNLSAFTRTYPWQVPIGLELNANSRLEFNRDQVRIDEANADSRRHENRDMRQVLSFVTPGAALGWGRVRDATPVYRVRILEDRLLATGTLVRRPSEDATRQLIDLFAIAADFGAAHDRPERFFWRRIERVLIDDGALRGDGIDAYGLFRAVEGVAPAVFRDRARLRGVFAGAAVSALHEHSHAEIEEVSSTETSTSTNMREQTNNFDTFMVGPRLSAHRPFGWRWQFGVDTQVLFPLRAGEGGFDAETRARASFWIVDRWLAELNASHDRQVFEPRRQELPPADNWRVSTAALLEYYLEDHLALSFGVSQTQASEWRRNTQFQIGTTYRFWRGLDAGDLVSERAFEGPP